MKRMGLRILRWSGLLIVLLLIAHAVWVWTLARKFERRLEEIRSRGETALSTEMARPQPLDEDNAAPLFKKADAWYREHAEQERPYAYDYPPREEWSDEEWEEMRTWVNSCGPYIQMLHEAVSRPSCWLDRDWSQPGKMPVPLIRMFRSAAGLLELRAVLDAKCGGDPNDSVTQLAALMRLGPLLDNRIGVHYLTGLDLQVYAVDTLQEIAHLLDARIVRSKLEPLLKAAERAEGLREVLIGDRAVGLQMVTLWIGGESPRTLVLREDETWGDVLLSSWLMRPWAYLDGLELIERMDETLAWSEKPFSDGRAGFEELATRVDGLGRFYLFTKMFASMWSVRIYERTYRHAAKVRLARIGLALLEHRQETGSWPPNLDSLKAMFGDSVPLNPLTNDAFRYERKSAKVRLEAEGAVTWEEVRDEQEIVWEISQSG
jgi:hypothetical protein